MSICETIEKKLNIELKPLHLEVINESHMHNVEPGSESHIRIVAVADIFSDLGLVKRHQLIYKHLNDEISGPIHAISLHTFSPQEWTERKQDTSPSPECLGGNENDSSQ